MWLPKDERELLVHYYQELHKSGVATRGTFYLSKLENCLQEEDKRNRVKLASDMLKQRNLLDFFNDQGDAITVQLSLEGYDLGRKCSSWWIRTGLWFAEYKDHWFWLILGFFGGIIGGILVNWLSTYFQKTPGAK